jgi:hypothetical protein
MNANAFPFFSFLTTNERTRLHSDPIPTVRYVNLTSFKSPRECKALPGGTLGESSLPLSSVFSNSSVFLLLLHSLLSFFLPLPFVLLFSFYVSFNSFSAIGFPPRCHWNFVICAYPMAPSEIVIFPMVPSDIVIFDFPDGAIGHCNFCDVEIVNLRFFLSLFSPF